MSSSNSAKRDWQPNCYLLVLGLIFDFWRFLRFHQLGQPYFLADRDTHCMACNAFLEGNGFSYPVGSSEPYLKAWMTATLPVSISFCISRIYRICCKITVGYSRSFYYCCNLLAGKRCRRLQIRLDKFCNYVYRFLGYKLAYPG